MDAEVTRIRDWLGRYLTAWRAALNNANESVRKHALGFPAEDLRAPVQFAVTVCADPNYPFRATALTLTHDAHAPDGEVVIEIAPPEALADRNNDLDKTLVAFFANMRANYVPGRALDPPVRAGSFMHHGLGAGGWMLHDDVSRLSIEDLIAHQFCEPAPVVIQPQPSFKPRYLFAQGEAREETTFTTWLESPGNLADLLEALGMRGPCWYAVSLPRSIVVPGANGDFDFVAGELKFNLTEDEWRVRRARIAGTYSLADHASRIDNETMSEVVRDGCIEWPPSPEATLVGVEVKVSKFDGKTGTLSSTHKNKGPRIEGQLKQLLKIGCTRVGFVHFFVTCPRGGWGTADQDLARAYEKLDEIAPLFNPEGFGYFSAGLAAVSHQDERLAGSQTRLFTHCEPRTYEQTPGSDSARRQLARALSELPRPRDFVQPIRACIDCKALFRAYVPSIDRCGCETTTNEGTEPK
ncbi:MAG: hypothetical protein JNK05_11665 [Myxococcales bacterium]|nr:hypothetical protein [Myxococcales bacterium]